MTKPTWRLEVAGVDAVTLRLFERIDPANMPWIAAATEQLRSAFGADLIDLVPSYTTVLVHYDVLSLDAGQACALIRQALDNLEPVKAQAGRERLLPTWYDTRVGPELAVLAARSGLSIADVIVRHSQLTYQVFALGFAPGFAFMGLVDEALACPRLNTPRQRIASGSVGIAERQTAAYPAASPGGWNIIGRTPVRLFDLNVAGYSLLQPGDQVRFVPIERDEFLRLGGDDTPLATAP